MNKTLSKTILHRTRFRNKYLKNKADENKESNHPSMLIIGEVCKKNPQFSFSYVDKDEII